LGTAKKTRLLIIGLDGAGFDVVRPLLDSGRMPNLQQLIADSARGDLESTIQPLTPLAWTSFLSGQNPGRHGVFDFFRRVDDTYTYRLVTASERSGHDFIDILSDAGLRVVSLNVPLTYPPREVNGAMVSGMGTPNLQVGFTWPPELRGELLKQIPGYSMCPPYDRGREVIPKALYRMVESRIEASLMLLEKYEPDVFLVVFQATDIVQHLFWRDYFNPGSKGADEAFADLIAQIYEMTDAGIGKIREYAGHDVPVLMLSDHGAQALDLVVGLNRFLADKGYLTFFPAGKYPGGGFKKSLRNAARGIILWFQRLLPVWIKNKIKSVIPGISKRVMNLWNVPDMSSVDFANTRAYAIGSYGGIFINLKGREPLGCINAGSEYETLRDEITNVLLEWSGADGKKIVERVHRREDIYAGPLVERAPDLVIELAPGNFTKTSFAPEKEPLYQSSQYQMFAHQHQSIHSMQGICIATGHPFNSGSEKTIEGARIIDLAPTILHTLGLEIPDDMDGSVLKELFDPEWFSSNPPRISSDIGMKKNSSRRKLSKEEEDKLKDDLQGLGYIQ
jgi:predicted AlkP superfamily phosphohydrolase/phosphomutase